MIVSCYNRFPFLAVQLVYAVLGVYLNLVAFALIRNGDAAEKAMAKRPEPLAPDYTTREIYILSRQNCEPVRQMSTRSRFAALPESSSLPEFGSAEWEALMATAEGPQALIEAGLAFLA